MGGVFWVRGVGGLGLKVRVVFFRGYGWVIGEVGWDCYLGLYFGAEIEVFRVVGG